MVGVGGERRDGEGIYCVYMHNFFKMAIIIIIRWKFYLNVHVCTVILSHCLCVTLWSMHACMHSLFAKGTL